MMIQTGFFYLYNKPLSLKLPSHSQPQGCPVPPNAGEGRKAACKTIGKENKALPTAPARLHVLGEGRVEGPRELLKIQRLLSTSAFGWKG